MCVCVCVRYWYLNPGVRGAELFNKLDPLVNHCEDLLLLHEGQGDVRVGVETHDLTGDRSRPTLRTAENSGKSLLFSKTLMSVWGSGGGCQRSGEGWYIRAASIKCPTHVNRLWSGLVSSEGQEGHVTQETQTQTLTQQLDV